jgi:hypothetical protein
MRILLTSGLLSANCGCGLISSVPAELGAIKLTPVSSASVEVRFVTVERDKGSAGYIVRGYVYRVAGAATTAQTRLHIKFLDEARTLLREEVIDFHPMEIDSQKKRRQPEPYGTYALRLPAFPRRTKEIEISADDHAP